MGEAIYHIIVIAVALVGIFRGFRSGLMRQVSGLLGFVFGIVAARAFGPGFAVWLSGWFPHVYHPVAGTFFISILGYGIIWALCMFAFSISAGVLNFILGAIPVGIVNSIAGAAFSLLKYLMYLSLLFDLALCRPFDSPLMHCVRHDDGNLVDGVIRLAPELLGTMSADEYVHKVQLWEARSIS
ncbi:MAG: CvpA family protein [Muribaculaceae bacterium]|nr:CvpA family protein [Muribaculaceae bacterium]